MQHWNLLYLNCLGFFSDPGYLLLSLLPVPCLEKGRFGRSVCGDRRKEPSPGRAYRSQFEEKRQRTFRPYRFTGFAERNVCLGRAAVESCWRQEHDRSSFSVGKLAYLAKILGADLRLQFVRVATRRFSLHPYVYMIVCPDCLDSFPKPFRSFEKSFR